MRRNRLTIDLQVAQKFFEMANEHERKLATTKGEPAKWRFAFNEFLNFLEINCGAYNRRQFGRGCRDIIRHKLEDNYIALQSNPNCHALVAEAIDRSSTFLELRRFIQ